MRRLHSFQVEVASKTPYTRVIQSPNLYSRCLQSAKPSLQVAWEALHPRTPNAQAAFGPNAAAKAQEALQITTEKANAAGFDLVRCDANTEDPEDALKRFTETLQSRKFAGVNIGYGLRGHKGTLFRIMNPQSASELIFPAIRAYSTIRKDAEHRMGITTWHQNHVQQWAGRHNQRNSQELPGEFQRFIGRIL